MMIQTMESWLSTVLIMHMETSERTWPISRLGVLADDLHIHVLANFIQQFTEAAGEAEEVQETVKVAMETHWYSGKVEELRSFDILRWVLRLQPQRRCCKRGRKSSRI